MIFGSEEPALFPVKDLYDTGMILSYINSVQKEYERGIAEQKEFLKNFGDFFSPISKDMESWDNLTMKPVRDAINFMLLNGIDPVRSAEGRALLGRLVNNINYGDLARLRQSAKNAELYQQAARDLAKAGFYNENQAKFLDGDLSSWDTLSKGTWNKVSPDKYMTEDQLIDPILSKLKPSFIKREGGYEWSGVTDDEIKKVLHNNIEDMLSTPNGQFLLSLYGGDKNAFEQSLAQRGHKYAYQTPSADQVYLTKLKMANDSREHALNRQNALQIAGMKKNNGNLQLSDKVEQRTLAKTRGDGTANNVNAQAFYQYFINLAKNSKDEKIRNKYNQYANEWKSYGNMKADERVAFLKKYKYIDDKGLLTDKYYDYLGKATGLFRGNSTQSRLQTINNASQIYSNYMVEMTGPEIEVALRNISGQRKPGKNGYYQVTFGNGVSYLRARAMQVAGADGMRSSISKDKDLTYKFTEWLDNPSSRVTGNAFFTGGMSAGKLPGNVLEITGLGVTVRKEKIDEFINLARKHGYRLTDGRSASGKSDAEILNDLGLPLVKSDGTPYTETIRLSGDASIENGKTVYTPKNYSKTTSKKQDQVYVAIPASKSINANGTNLSGFNDDYNKEVYGSGSAYKELFNALLSGEQFSGE